MGVRVTEAEAEELQERSQAARLSMGAYLRQRGLGQRVRMGSGDPLLQIILEWIEFAGS